MDWDALMKVPTFDAATLRETVLKMAFAGSTVHVGCAFSLIEILAVLYRNYLRFPSDQARAPGRDFLVLSKGHGVMAQYACLYQKGWLGDEDIRNYFGDGTHLKGLADAHIPGIEATSGSLGHGLSVAAGFGLAIKRNETDQRCYVIVGDGEINEGAIWEAALFAAQFKLDNIMVIVDQNGYQAMGKTDDIMQLGSIEVKFSSFGFDALTVDGHDEKALDVAIRQLQAQVNGRPKALVAKTVKGKGVSFMENNNIWHYTRLDSDSYQAAVAEIMKGHLPV